MSQVNPLTYEVDALRGLMIVDASSSYGIGFDLLVLFAGMIALVVIGSRVIPKWSYSYPQERGL
jgi:ABC-2 type transport system permease protein